MRDASSVSVNRIKSKSKSKRWCGREKKWCGRQYKGSVYLIAACANLQAVSAIESVPRKVHASRQRCKRKEERKGKKNVAGCLIGCSALWALLSWSSGYQLGTTSLSEWFLQTGSSIEIKILSTCQARRQDVQTRLAW